MHNDDNNMNEAKKSFNKTLKLCCIQFSGNLHPHAHMRVARKMLMDSVEAENPFSLYRFQPCSKRNFNDLREGRIHLSLPSSFNDPFDTNPVINTQAAAKRMDCGITPSNMLKTIREDSRLLPYDQRHSFYQSGIGLMEDFDKMKADHIKEMVETVNEKYGSFRDELHCACFIERVNAPNMWANYADEGRGFALSYLLDQHGIKCTCGASGRCRARLSFTVCPVEYGSYRYDITPYTHVLMGSSGLSPWPEASTYLLLVDSMVHKGEEWSSEHEWRVVCGCCPKSRGTIYMKAEPTAIYAGYNIKPSDLGILKKIAQKKRIPIYQACVPYRSDGYELKMDEIGQ